MSRFWVHPEDEDRNNSCICRPCYSFYGVAMWLMSILEGRESNSYVSPIPSPSQSHYAVLASLEFCYGTRITWIYRDLPAWAFQALALKVCTITFSYCSHFTDNWRPEAHGLPSSMLTKWEPLKRSQACEGWAWASTAQHRTLSPCPPSVEHRQAHEGRSTRVYLK